MATQKQAAIAVLSIQPVDTFGVGDMFHRTFGAQYDSNPYVLSVLMGAS
ncbi:MAG: hypothetical protein F6K00_09010 [Leptolyngbya sp. SIOISBB]|nr:hypothetical protein [Leptolyngbya sp. SIOISBB]